MKTEKSKVVVIGAGLTGLTAAWKLSEMNHDVQILEITGKIGGISGSFQYKELILDIGPHKIYTLLPGILDEIKHIIKDDLLEIQKVSSIRLIGRYFDYPLDMKNLLLRMNPAFALKCGLSYGFTTLSNIAKKKEDRSYESYIVNRFGETAYNFVFKPLAEKTWGDPKKLDPSLAKTRVPMPSLIEMAKNIITGKKHKPKISAKTFYYPKKGIVQLSEKIQEKIISNNGKLRLNAEPIEIRTEGDKVKSVKYKIKGKIVKTDCDFLMSTANLKDLIKLIKPSPPKEVIESVNALRFRSLIIVYIIANKKKIMKENWIFFPEKEFVFNRVSEQKNSSKFIFPENKSVLMAEITCEHCDEKWNLPDKSLYGWAINDLEKAGILRNEEVEDYLILKIKDIYPSYTIGYKDNLNKVLNYLSNFKNLISNGRPGLFNYNNMDHCMEMGIIGAEHIANKKPGKEWLKQCRYFETYSIVD